MFAAFQNQSPLPTINKRVQLTILKMNLRLDRYNIEMYYGAILREEQSAFIG